MVCESPCIAAAAAYACRHYAASHDDATISCLIAYFRRAAACRYGHCQRGAVIDDAIAAVEMLMPRR